MALFRFGVPFTDRKLRSYLNALRDRPVNFDTPVEQMTVEHGWIVDGSHDEIGTEPQGPPVHDGIFARARQAIINYDFSDPSIVVGHFDPTTPPVGRDMLLELKVLGFRFLCGARVMEVRDDYDGNTTYFGFRYDTLEGHIERGYEWFLLTKDHETGGIHFRIEAHWQLGQFPNLWSKIGFKLIGEHYRATWRRRAPARLRRIAHQPVSVPIAVPGDLAHRGGETGERTDPRPAT